MYEVEVTDLNDRGGARHAYRLDLLVPEPDYRLTAKADRFVIEPGQTVEAVGVSAHGEVAGLRAGGTTTGTSPRPGAPENTPLLNVPA